MQMPTTVSSAPERPTIWSQRYAKACQRHLCLGDHPGSGEEPLFPFLCAFFCRPYSDLCPWNHPLIFQAMKIRNGERNFYHHVINCYAFLYILQILTHFYKFYTFLPIVINFTNFYLFLSILSIFINFTLVNPFSSMKYINITHQVG